MTRTKKILICSACLVAAAVIALPVLAHFKQKSNKIPRCHYNLEQIWSYKQMWEGNRTTAEVTNDAPTWDDLRPYFSDGWSNSIPVCPDGGVYTIGRLGEDPRCSIGKRYSHSLH
jgi:hypothetical protein